jgi:hypothetical protein
LIFFAYTGTRKGTFDGGPEKPEEQVTIVGGEGALVYDDEKKGQADRHQQVTPDPIAMSALCRSALPQVF